MNPDSASASALLDSTHGKPSVLVVDDQPAHMELLVQALCDDYQVYMATSGAQALGLCQSVVPDLILLDVQMPGMDGFAVCKALKAAPSTAKVPVIMVTARSDPGQETHSLSLGAADCVTKPITPAVVRARVHTHLTLKFQADMLDKLVLWDGLSGVFNRRFFDHQLASEWARSTRSGMPLSLVLVDIDHFSAYNARYGHQAGDEGLRRIASTLKAVVRRPADVVARFAGEEFACLLPDTSPADARALAHDMVRQVGNLGSVVPHQASLQHITVSAGVVTRTHACPGTVVGFLQEARTQLDLAKAEGVGKVRSNIVPAPAQGTPA